MSKREALGTNPTVKREVALGMKKEPPAKQVKEEVKQEPEERHGRLPEYEIFKQDPVNWRGWLGYLGKDKGCTHLWRKHLHSFLASP